MKQTPSWIAKDAQALFRKIIERIEDTPANRETLAMLCQSYSDYRQAVETIKTEGLLIETKTTKKYHPAYTVAKMSAELYAKLAAELQLTPKSKKGNAIEVDSELEALLGG